MPAVLKTQFRTFKATTDTHCFLPRLLATKGRYEQQCLPEDPCVLPASALLIHFDFAKQTFNFTRICQMSLQSSSQHVSCHNEIFFFFYADDISHPKLATAAVISHRQKTTQHTAGPAATDSSTVRINGEGKIRSSKWTGDGFQGM